MPCRADAMIGCDVLKCDAAMKAPSIHAMSKGHALQCAVVRHADLHDCFSYENRMCLMGPNIAYECAAAWMMNGGCTLMD